MRTLFLISMTVPAAPLRLKAQGLEFRGEATNLGLASRPTSTGLTGSLLWRVPNGTRPTGELLIGTPLGGSGPARATRWADTLLIVSAGAAGDTIAWIGTMSDNAVRGEYLILGGGSKDQGGRWSLAGVGLARIALSARPDSDAIAVLVAATATMRAPVGSMLPVAARQQRQTNATSDWAIFAWLLLGSCVVAGTALAIRLNFARARISAGSVAAQPGQFAVACPLCGKRSVDRMGKFWFMHGFLLVTRYGSRTLVGCRSCIAEEGLKILAINSVAGWWCIPWGVGTPLVVLQNVVALFVGSSTEDLEAALRAADIDPNEVRLDERGFTREQRIIVEGASFILATAIWADDIQHDVELARAVAILEQLTGGRIPERELRQLIAEGRGHPQSLVGLGFELRRTLLEIALDIALADGVLSLSEIGMLHGVAERLGFGKSAVDELLDQAMGHSRGGKTGSRDTGSRRSRGSDDVERAWLTLGVRRGATPVEIKQAWRSAILKYHPDRAGSDRAKQAEFTHRSQEINWAYSTLQRSASGIA